MNTSICSVVSVCGIIFVRDAEGRLIEGANGKGETSRYLYDAFGARVGNVRTRENENREYRNFRLDNGSRFMKDYLRTLSDGRASDQPLWESEAGTAAANDTAVENRTFVVDFAAPVFRDAFVAAEGMYEAAFSHDPDGREFVARFSRAEGTRPGEAGENLGSEAAEELVSLLVRRSDRLGSPVFSADERGEVALHQIYDAWGRPLTDANLEANFFGADPDANFTGYAFDKTLGLFFAQNRFYDPVNMRFTREDPQKDGSNWYAYCGGDPLNAVDPWGLAIRVVRGAGASDNAWQTTINNMSTVAGQSVAVDENGYVTFEGGRDENTDYKLGNELVNRVINHSSTVTIVVDSTAMGGREYDRDNKKITYNPYYTVLLITEGHEKEGQYAPGYIVLAHELIHADRDFRGIWARYGTTQNWYPTGETTTECLKIGPMQTDWFPKEVPVMELELNKDGGNQIRVEELATVRLGKYPTDSEDGLQNIAENDIRREHGLPKRLAYNHIGRKLLYEDGAVLPNKASGK